MNFHILRFVFPIFIFHIQTVFGFQCDLLGLVRSKSTNIRTDACYFDKPFAQSHFKFTGTRPLIISPTKITSVKMHGGLEGLGQDALIFLGIVVTVVPVFDKLNISPILGFLGMGVILGPSGLGLLRDMNDLDSIGQLGILFLLFEQGLELSLPRVKALSQYAFGLGFKQVVFSIFAFAVFPFVGGVTLLEELFKSPPNLVHITRIDEAFVIAAALSLSSSAFVLKILQEKGKLAEKFSKASLGVLLFQDIAIIPLLVLLPIIETEKIDLENLAPQFQSLGFGFLKSFVGVSAIVAVGRLVFKEICEFVASARSKEAFVALVLYSAIGTGVITKELGLSDSLGAFLAGLLLAETNFKAQIEADIQSFRGLFLALFFMTTGATVDPVLLIHEWPTTLALLFGLLAIKASIISLIGTQYGLTFPESVKTGILLSGGGEFAFVILTLAVQLKVVPENLSPILVGVVVLSMALTPALYYMGEVAETFLNNYFFKLNAVSEDTKSFEGMEVIVLCGYDTSSQVITEYFSAPEVNNMLNTLLVCFEVDPKQVLDAQSQGYEVLLGDGSQPSVLQAHKIDNPKAIIITSPDVSTSIEALTRLRTAYPKTPLFVSALDYEDYWKLVDAGATQVLISNGEMGVALATGLLDQFSLSSAATSSVEKNVRGTFRQLAKHGFSQAKSATEISELMETKDQNDEISFKN